MMKLILSIALFLGLSASAVQAEERAAQAASFRFPPLTQLYEDGFLPEKGDIIYLTRPFNSWSLKCELLLSQDKRLCQTQQTIQAGGDTLVWRIVLTQENIPYVLINSNSGIDLSKGIRMGFSGIEKTLREQTEIGCTQTDCFAAFPFVGFVQAAILNSHNIWFVYYRDGKQVRLNASMNGLSDALQAAATNPYGTLEKPPTKPTGKKPAKK